MEAPGDRHGRLRTVCEGGWRRLEERPPTAGRHAGLCLAPTTSPWATGKQVLPDEHSRYIYALVDRAYNCATQVMALANNMSLLACSMDRMLYGKEDLTPEELHEAQVSMGAFLQMAQAFIKAGGRTQALMQMTARSMWLGLSGLGNKERRVLAAVPISEDTLFGEGINDHVEKLESSHKYALPGDSGTVDGTVSLCGDASRGSAVLASLRPFRRVLQVGVTTPPSSRTAESEVCEKTVGHFVRPPVDEGGSHGRFAFNVSPSAKSTHGAEYGTSRGHFGDAWRLQTPKCAAPTQADLSLLSGMQPFRGSPLTTEVRRGGANVSAAGRSSADSVLHGVGQNVWTSRAMVRQDVKERLCSPVLPTTTSVPGDPVIDTPHDAGERVSRPGGLDFIGKRGGVESASRRQGEGFFLPVFPGAKEVRGAETHLGACESLRCHVATGTHVSSAPSSETGAVTYEKNAEMVQPLEAGPGEGQELPTGAVRPGASGSGVLGLSGTSDGGHAGWLCSAISSRVHELMAVELVLHHFAPFIEGHHV
ncbi:uncharacterized protein LOC128761226 [Synchiropus splendidus]|uniref:uncharacterized protein LOC128761226 n=1 Tax=Synchiropus splendidus TaxID=270530 RepID=UPI00237DB67C|nr:uncharacterized protein LOC128761226 [Synchiropus splendidus]